MKYSLTYTGVITFVIGYLFQLAGVPFVPENLEQTISFLVTFAGVVTSLYGRYRVGDINRLGVKYGKY